jgi:hypothetical protein
MSQIGGPRKPVSITALAIIAMADGFARESGYDGAIAMAEDMEKVLGPPAEDAPLEPRFVVRGCANPTYCRIFDREKKVNVGRRYVF